MASRNGAPRTLFSINSKSLWNCPCPSSLFHNNNILEVFPTRPIGIALFALKGQICHAVSSWFAVFTQGDEKTLVSRRVKDNPMELPGKYKLGLAAGIREAVTCLQHQETSDYPGRHWWPSWKFLSISKQILPIFLSVFPALQDLEREGIGNTC